MNVALVIPRLGAGGAARSTIDLARMLQNSRKGLRHSLVVLGECAKAVADEAGSYGIRVIPGGSSEEARRAIREADLVHVQFWNTPEMYAWLSLPQPAMRLVLTLDVAGEFPSQILTPQLLEFADWIVPTTAYSPGLPEMQALAERKARVRVILPGMKMPEEDAVRTSSATLRVGYAGTVDFVKMHEQYVEMCARVRAPHVEFPIAGRGEAEHALKRRVNELGIAEKFAWLGFREDIQDVIASFDVFGYPLAREAYATADLTLQLAMWQGVPPVILGHGALPHLVQDGETGIVARDAEGYADAIERLCEDRTERERIGRNARAYAQSHFGADKSAIELGVVYDAAMQEPKRERKWAGAPEDPRFPGASALIESFGAAAGSYLESMRGSKADERQRADGKIANAPPLEMSAGAGGVLDYRRAHPTDGFLRLWSGLMLGQRGRAALAAGEFQAAIRGGVDEERARIYFERVMKHDKPWGGNASE